MDLQVPSHHIRQNICATRPPYREGKHPKAVKVYTVVNESSYLLIHGVPCVGATQELHKLCSSFGLVDAFRALDDYPVEDKYSEVYLVKYKKIQAARFAKRKLDDHSFFGGALHVCYAPEYESVMETREKLQERRKVVASKIRQHAEHSGKQQTLTSEVTQMSLQSLDASLHKTRHHLPATQEFNQQVSNLQSDLETPATVSTPAMLNFLPDASSVINRPNTVNEAPQVEETFLLPLPPKPHPVTHAQTRFHGGTYEYSRVPSAHATLPAGYDARLTPPVFSQLQQPENKHVIEGNKDVIITTETNKLSSSSQDVASSAVARSDIIVKSYQPAKAAPRFVPRQTLMKTERVVKHPQVRTHNTTDLLDQDIRRNAFCLGEAQGPAGLPQRKRTLVTAAQQSVNETIMKIRKKISKVITQNVKNQTDLKGHGS